MMNRLRMAYRRDKLLVTLWALAAAATFAALFWSPLVTLAGALAVFAMAREGHSRRA